MRIALALLLAAVGGCVPAVEAPPPAAETIAGRPAMPGFDAAAVRAAVEADAAARLGAEAVRLAAAASSSILVTHHQGLPRPVRNADGSWGYEPPGANAMIRTGSAWSGWTGRDRRAVPPARAAEIERILADPAFWAEPDYVPPACTDAGARRLVVRHAGRVTARQQGCGGVGLTGRLWELVYRGPV
ncbi:MAG: hypothetical protein QOI38_1655 [Sphingomonadales bacterium]|jgi:hypothetical protein|nr:hypothetical protein [Sphingomonadales bacterium]